MTNQPLKVADVDKVPAVTKAIAVIRFIDAAGAGGASLFDIHTRLGLTKSHTFNILKSLTREGWLSYDEARRVYLLSPRLLSDIASVFNRTTRAASIHEELVKLARDVNSPCVLSRVGIDGSFIVIDNASAPNELLFSAPIGHRFPPDSPAQMRARLAWMPPAEREAELARLHLTAYTAATIADMDGLRAELEATRRRGFGISRAEYTPGVFSVSAPLFNALGEVEMVLQVTGVSPHIADENGQAGAKLRVVADRLNATFGYSPAAS